MKVEVQKYYSNPSLLMLFVISCTTKLPEFDWYFHRNDDAKKLFGMNKISLELDNNSFQLLRNRSGWDNLLAAFVFNPERSQELVISGGRYAQTALHILEYLCRRRDQPYSLFHGPADTFRQTGHIINFNRARQIRVDKHQRGRLPLKKSSADSKPCKMGLKILPELLKRATRSNELIAFIHLYLRRIVVIGKWTRRAFNCISDYLDRVTQYTVVD